MKKPENKIFDYLVNKRSIMKKFKDDLQARRTTDNATLQSALILNSLGPKEPEVLIEVNKKAL